MAQLYFKYGAMGSSKTANALMARFNYEERGQKALMVKPQVDIRDGDHMVHSRIGLTYPCLYFHEMRALPEAELKQYAGSLESFSMSPAQIRAATKERLLQALARHFGWTEKT